MKSLEECRSCSHHVDEIGLQVVCDYWNELECRPIHRDENTLEDFVVPCPWDEILEFESRRQVSA